MPNIWELHAPLKHKHKNLKGVSDTQEQRDAHHREWGWSDEQGWEKKFVLPLSKKDGWTNKYAGNPIITRGATGSFDDERAIQPCCVRVGGTYYLFYAGRLAADLKIRIGLATSTDGYNFTKYVGPGTGGSILDTGGAGAFDERRAYMPYVVYDTYEIDATKRWKMWYTGMDAAYATSVGYAYSSDGYSWTKYPGNPLTVTNFQIGSSVMRLGNLYQLLYTESTARNLDLATSNDGINWERYGTVVTKGGAGAWDADELGYASLWWNMGTWYIFYCGYSAAVLEYKIGLARSTDGFSFTKYVFNPVVPLGGAGAFDEKYAINPSILQVDDKFRVYYHGRSAAGVEEIGLVELP